MGQGEPQFRQPFEIGNARNSQRGSPLARQRQSIGVAEAERLRNADPFLAQQTADRRFVRDILTGEDFGPDRAGVFGIDVDLAGHQGIEHDACPAELAVVDGVEPAVGGQEPQHFAQNDRLGEFFRPDSDLRRPPR